MALRNRALERWMSRLWMPLAAEYDLDPAAEVDYSEVTTVREVAEYAHGLLDSGGEA